MDWVICSPEEYNSLRMRDFIIGECRLPRNRWIYDIIENKIRDPGECIFIDHSAWCLCLDKHSGEDRRYLVVFKNTELKTIRNLTQAHLPMLEDVNKRITAWLREHDPGEYTMYFHFLPSVFQLHLHVRLKRFCRCNARIQPLQTIMRNLNNDTRYYQDALILTKFCKRLQRAETHTKIELNI